MTNLREKQCRKCGALLMRSMSWDKEQQTLLAPDGEPITAKRRCADFAWFPTLTVYLRRTLVVGASYIRAGSSPQSSLCRPFVCDPAWEAETATTSEERTILHTGL